MKAKDLKCNKMYWSTRFDRMGFCTAFAEYMAHIIFLDNKNNGWYHCSELEEIKSER